MPAHPDEPPSHHQAFGVVFFLGRKTGNLYFLFLPRTAKSFGSRTQEIITITKIIIKKKTKFNSRNVIFGTISVGRVYGFFTFQFYAILDLRDF